MAESYISTIVVNEENFLVKDNEAREQLENLSNVASTGSYTDLLNKPTLGTAAATDIDAYDVAGAANEALITAKTYTDTISANYVLSNTKGVANGVATLDENGLIPSSQLPSYVDDVLAYESISGFPAEGESDKIYVDKTTNLTYRWGGNDYVEISKSLALGETSATAYSGDKGKALADKLNEMYVTVDTTTHTLKIMM